MFMLLCPASFILLVSFCEIGSLQILLFLLLILTCSVVTLLMPASSSSLSGFLAILITLIRASFFGTSSLLWFFLCYEVVLVPVSLIILLFGYQPEKIFASFLLIRYTLVGSLPLFYLLISSYPAPIWELSRLSFATSLAVSLSFLIKRPLYFLHSWLPKAHVESPLLGSILLSGILLKYGAYGVFLLSLSYQAWFPLVSSISLLGSLSCALICLRSSDIKSLIAYSSVVHIGLVTLGFLSSTELGYFSSASIMFSHTLVSPLIFCLAFVQYSAYGTRSFISYAKISLTGQYNGIVCIVCAANFGLPPFIGFFSEFSIFTLFRYFCSCWWFFLFLVSIFTFCYSIIIPLLIFGLGFSSEFVVVSVRVIGYFGFLASLLLACLASSLFLN